MAKLPEQPLPVPSAPAVLLPHTVSVQPRVLFAFRSEVSPMATTVGELAGYWVLAPDLLP
ncbi:hypothetical protein AB0K51_14045 [Kitasatospora sp. NPDC049285]|uniref:hypothetical protein n=1 Tax=Kitasatospora sp. NPDC049285 TaxID=3157096 RepID=UPI00341242AF